MKNKLIFTFLATLLFVPFNVHAELSADEIAQKVYDRDDGKDSHAFVDMTLIEQDGGERPRKMEVVVKDFGKLSKRLIRFTEPASIKGTAFLGWEKEEGNDDQFLFLPAVGRTRRIVGSQKNKQFANTDFTYEDLERRKPDLDVHRISKSESVIGRDCWVIEYTPKEDSSSQYGRTLTWVDKVSYLALKSEFYSKENKLVKLFDAKSVKQIDGYWTVMESMMNDLEAGHKTKSVMKEVLYNKGAQDSWFTERHLELNE